MPRIFEDTFSNASVRRSFQRKLFRRQGRIYLFWGDKFDNAKTLYYAFSDAISGLTTAEIHRAVSAENAGSQYGNQYDVVYDRDAERVGIAWVRENATGTHELFFKWGTFTAQGAIDWSEERPVHTAAYEFFRDPVLGCAASGKWGIFVRRFDGTTHEAAFYSCNTATPQGAGNWTDHGHLTGHSISSAYRAQRVWRIGNSGDDLLLLFRRDDNLVARRWDGAALGGEKIVDVNIKSQDISGMVADSAGNVHVACFDDRGDYRIKHAIFDATANDWDANVEEMVSPAGKLTRSLALQIDSNDQLHLLFKRNSHGQAPEKLYYMRRTADGWRDETASLTGDLADPYLDLRDTPVVPFFDADTVFVAWVNETQPEANELWMNSFVAVEPPIPPQADFAADPTSGKAPLEVHFSDHSQAGSRPISGYQWEFGDGQTSTEKDPVHVYENPGTYAVKLTVTDGALSDTKTVADFITAEAVAPGADFTADPTSGKAPLEVHFSDHSQAGSRPISGYQWDFGDGQTSTEKDPVHVYENPGTYAVKLTVTDGVLSDSKTVVDFITAEAVAPGADFTADPRSGKAPLEVHFSDHSQAGSLPISGYQWDFGDGQTSTEKDPVHVYENPGTYAVKLTVTDGVLSDSKTVVDFITAEAVAPGADFTADPTSGKAPLEVHFSDHSQAGSRPISGYQWDFGDGQTSTEKDPVHVYENPGTYAVKLTVTDGALSDTKTVADFITAEAVAPGADFTADPTSGKAPLEVHFSDHSQAGSRPISGYQWDFGDGQTSTEKDPVHVYENPGTYAVKLTVTDGVLSDSKTVVDFITAEAVAPAAAFTGEPTHGETPLTVHFRDTSTPGSHPITEWQWDFGDGSASTAQHPQHTYQSAGKFSVSLKVSDGSHEHRHSIPDFIEATAPAVPPTADFSGTPTRGTAPLKVSFRDQSQTGTQPLSSWQWDFGDGHGSNAQHPSHFYKNPGIYSVQLTVSDGNLSDSKMAQNYIAVAAPVDDCYAARFRCMLCYLLFWVSGLYFWLFERKSKCVRFHALQSLITFGGITLLVWLLHELALLEGTLLFLIGIFTLLLWLLLMMKALQGLRYKLPLIGAFAERVVYGR